MKCLNGWKISGPSTIWTPKTSSTFSLLILRSTTGLSCHSKHPFLPNLPRRWTVPKISNPQNLHQSTILTEKNKERNIRKIAQGDSRTILITLGLRKIRGSFSSMCSESLEPSTSSNNSWRRFPIFLKLLDPLATLSLNPQSIKRLSIEARKVLSQSCGRKWQDFTKVQLSTLRR